MYELQMLFVDKWQKRLCTHLNNQDLLRKEAEFAGRMEALDSVFISNHDVFFSQKGTKSSKKVM